MRRSVLRSISGRFLTFSGFFLTADEIAGGTDDDEETLMLRQSKTQQHKHPSSCFVLCGPCPWVVFTIMEDTVLAERVRAARAVLLSQHCVIALLF